MGQTKSKPFPTTLTSNSWRRLSDSDCIHLLSHQEYFDDNNLIKNNNKEHENGNYNRLHRSGSTSTFFDAIEQSSLDEEDIASKATLKSSHQINPNLKNPNHIVIRSISVSSSTTPQYRNSMYPGCVEHHQANCFGSNHRPLPSSSPPPPIPSTSQLLSSSPPPLPPPLTARIRPISMFAFDDDDEDDAAVVVNDGPEEILHGLSSPTSVTPPPVSLKQIENLNISLNDLLERVNTTDIRLRNTKQSLEDNEDDSAQTVISKHVDEIDDNDNRIEQERPGSGKKEIDNNLEDNQKDDRNNNNKILDKQQKNLEKSTKPMKTTSTGNNKTRTTLATTATTTRQVRKPIRCSGLDCMCDRCIKNRFKLLNWLLPNCTRMNSERLLSGKPDGTFLVRKSEKFPGQYTLSFVCRRTVRHCLIMRSVYGFGLRWPYSFETLQQVIIHYSKNSLTEFNSKLNIQLKYPVFFA